MYTAGPRMGGPPPPGGAPPPPAGEFKPPKASKERKNLLKDIESPKNKRGLKKTVTNDRSAPNLSMRT